MGATFATIKETNKGSSKARWKPKGGSGAAAEETINLLQYMKKCKDKIQKGARTADQRNKVLDLR